MNFKEQKNKNDFFLNTYKRIPLDISHGEGIHLITKDGQRYLDFFSGLAVNALGHSHPLIINAVTEQIKKFAHVSNYYVTDVQNRLAELLIKYSGMSKVFLTNSGTEAAETAIKLIRKLKGPDGIIFSLSNSFHGRTYGSMSLSGREINKEYFSPLLQNMGQINFNDKNDLLKKINSDSAAVVLEFIQGEGGINVVHPEFVELLFELKEKYNFLIVADEIQSGIGRTGKPFAFNHYNVVPDIILVAKAIGGGLPLGALLTSSDLGEAFSPGDHGTTFGGNPVACAAGIVVLEEVFEKQLISSVEKLGDYLYSELVFLQQKFTKLIKEVRGKGFLIGVELTSECDPIVEKLRKRKILINCTNKNVLRILPPLIAEKSDIDFFLYNFHQVISSDFS